jgi:hypothetical protein
MKRQSVNKLALWVCLSVLAGLPSIASADSLIDGINSGAALENIGTLGLGYDGFLYSPSISYELGSVETRFGLGLYYYSGGDNNQVITTSIFEVNGPLSTIDLSQPLGTESFVANSDNSWYGGNFATPIPIDSGSTYFVLFGDMEGMGNNIVYDSSATTHEGYYYGDPFLYGSIGSMDYATPLYGDLTAEFYEADTSPVPETSSFVLLATGLMGTLGAIRRRETHASDTHQ